jgi:type IX secretion system PorP/SprF family membrane protein
MKKYYLFLICSLIAAAGSAQQEEQFTQFMYNKMVFNPGAAGSESTPTFTGMVRSQWLGMEGAPETQLLSASMPIQNERAGFGGYFMRQTIGLTEHFEVNAIYSYRLRLGVGFLRIGLQSSVRLIRSDFTKAVAVQAVETDAAIPIGIQSKYIPNFGAGAYYYGQAGRIYVGVGIPRFLQNNIDLADSDDVLTREIRHFYVMGGTKFAVGGDARKLNIQPQVLLKYVKGAPFDADVNVNAQFADKFTTGISYRIGGSKSSSLGESVSLLLGMDLTEKLTFSLSYDATLSELNSYNNGSVEGALIFRVGGKSQGNQRDPDNGRFF